MLQGKQLYFVTNNSTKSRAGYLSKFTSLGLNISAVSRKDCEMLNYIWRCSCILEILVSFCSGLLNLVLIEALARDAPLPFCMTIHSTCAASPLPLTPSQDCHTPSTITG